MQAPSQATQTPSRLERVRELISDDMERVNLLIKNALSSEVALIGQLGHYIINSGGKRLRPAMVLLSAGACGYKGNNHINIAAIIEFIHTATLLHDDVVDSSDLRRGNETANAIWGNEASVLVGDFLYSRAFEMMVEVADMRIMDVLSHATNTIAEGEVMQLLNIHNADTTQAEYMNVIYCKTAKLFEAATRLGAILADRQADEIEALADYGRYLGTAFQLIDDVLDYSENTDTIGKNIGDDLAEGKPTLPLIHALHNGDAKQAQLIRTAIEQGGREHIQAVRQCIESTGAITYTAQLARSESQKAKQALTCLPDNAFKMAMIELADFAVEREY